MNRDYLHELDILVDEHNGLLEDFQSKNIEEYGLIDLKRFFDDFSALHSENLLFDNQARFDRSIDSNDYDIVRDRCKELYESHREALNAINEKKSVKEALKDEKKKEILQVKRERYYNEKNISKLESNLIDLKNNYYKIANTSSSSIFDSLISELENSINDLKELNKLHNEIITNLEKEIDILNNGGLLEKIEEIKDEVDVLDEDEIKEMTSSEIINVDSSPIINHDSTLDYSSDTSSDEIDIDEKETEHTVIEPLFTSEDSTLEEDTPSVGDTSEDDLIELEDEITLEEESNKSLSWLVSTGVIPSILGQEKIIEVCNKLGIPAFDLNYEPTVEELDRLKHDSVVQNANINMNMIKKHQEKVDEYNRIIEDYQQLLDEKMDDETFSEEFVSKIESIKEALEEERDSYIVKINAIKEDCLNGHFEIRKSSKLSRQSRSTAKKEKKTNEKLVKIYQELDHQREVKSDLLTERMKKRQEKRIEKTMKKIEALRNKKGIFYENQVMIINENTEKYIDKVSKKQAKYFERQEKVNRNVDTMIAASDRIFEANQQLDNIEHDLDMVEGKGLSARISRIGLNRDLKSLNREIERLQKKQGKCDKRVQHIKVTSKSR